MSCARCNDTGYDSFGPSLGHGLCTCAAGKKRARKEGEVVMNLYDDKQKQIGEVNFQMGGAVVTFKEGNKNRPEGEVERKLVIPNLVFDAIKRLGGKASSDVEAAHKTLRRIDHLVAEHCSETNVASTGIEDLFEMIDMLLRSRMNLLDEVRSPTVVKGRGEEITSIENGRRIHDNENLTKRVAELGEAVESLRRQRDVRTKMINILFDELDDHG